MSFDKLDKTALGYIGELMENGSIPRVFVRVKFNKKSKEVELPVDPEPEVLKGAVDSLVKYLSNQ